MHSVIGLDARVDADLKCIFGNDLHAACDWFEHWFHKLGIHTSPAKQGYDMVSWEQLLISAMNGERGKNFIGQQSTLLACYGN